MIAERKNIFLFLLFCFLCSPKLFCQTGGNPILSEVMFRPAENSGEFVEIYNCTLTDTFELSGLKLKYYTSAADGFVEFMGGTKLLPGKYAALIEEDYDFEKGILKKIIPAGTVIMKTADNAFGSSGMANSTDRKISLIDAAGAVIDEYIYSADNAEGISDEKIILADADNSANWANSLIVNGTPGQRNSVSPKTNDLRILSFVFLSKYGIDKIPVKAKIEITNAGSKSVASAELNIFRDINNDSTAQSAELAEIYTIENVESSGAASVEIEIGNYENGKNIFIAEIALADDESPGDNICFAELTGVLTNEKRGDIVINEIMYAPVGSEPEWIELFNLSNLNVEFHGYRLADEHDTAMVFSNNKIFYPGEYFVIARDSSIISKYGSGMNLIISDFPSLNNSNDRMMVLDSLGRVIDSLYYNSRWGGSLGKSLERINAGAASVDSLNWSASVDRSGATPGRKNSVTQKDHDLGLTGFSFSKKYFFDREAARGLLSIRNYGKYSAENYTIKIFRDANSDSLSQDTELALQITPVIVPPGKTEQFNFTISDYPQGINLFIAVVVLEGDESKSNDLYFSSFEGVITNEQRGDLVINEIMYSPAAGEPEWFEVFNAGSKTVFLDNYGIADLSDTVRIPDGAATLLPGEYLVVSRDSIISQIFSVPSKILICVFPPLGNTSDAIILIDRYGRTIDSVSYNSQWGGKTGVSLERISAEENSNNPLNWTSSKCTATPGKINSASQKLFDVAINDFFILPSKPCTGDSLSFSVSVKNPGRFSADFKAVLGLLDDNMNQNIIEIFDRSLNPGDSAEIFFNTKIQLIAAADFFAKILFEADQDTSNNIAEKSVSPTVPPGAVVINEIMFDPVDGEPEWFEIFNKCEYGIDLTNWTVSDVLTAPVTKTISRGEMILSAGSFLLIAKDSSIVQYYKCLPSHFAVMNFANLNNDRDGVVLRDFYGNTIDSVFYGAGFSVCRGRSLERISVESPSGLIPNWLPCNCRENGTPGRINSVTPKNLDVEITGIRTDPEFPVQNGSVVLICEIANRGCLRAENISVTFAVLADNGGTFIGEAGNISLDPDDTTEAICTVPRLLDGRIKAACRAILASDEDTVNNYFEREIIPGAAVSSVIINEIMYDPMTGESEWIEILNVTEESVNLKGWTVSDAKPSPLGGMISGKDFFIRPGEFAVITNDSLKYRYEKPSAFFEVKYGALGNSADGVILHDFRNAVIDRVDYEAEWGGSGGYSLERISVSQSSADAKNWCGSLCNEKATPGKINSVAELPETEFNAVVINEIMYDPAEGNCEFIELYNSSANQIQLGRWKLISGPEYYLSRSPLILMPGEYFLLTADSSVYHNYSGLTGDDNVGEAGTSSLDLSNSGEKIILKDFRGAIIDSLTYSPEWHNLSIAVTKNFSLERINPGINSCDESNWSSSAGAAGATPCRINSVYTESVPAVSRAAVNPNPFSPDNDGFEDFTIISLKLSEKISSVRIKVYDASGRLVRMIVNGRPAGSTFDIIFDGLDGGKTPLRIGIYILLIEITSESGNVVEVIKAPIVIARKL